MSVDYPVIVDGTIIFGPSKTMDYTVDNDGDVLYTASWSSPVRVHTIDLSIEKLVNLSGGTGTKGGIVFHVKVKHAPDAAWKPVPTYNYYSGTPINGASGVSLTNADSSTSDPIRIFRAIPSPTDAGGGLEMTASMVIGSSIYGVQLEQVQDGTTTTGSYKINLLAGLVS